jgi:hypothetical protein
MLLKISKRIRVKYPLFLSNFNETWIFWTYIRKKLKYKVYKNLSNESRVIPCGQTDMTKLIVDFCNFENAPKKLFCIKIRDK